MSSKIELLDKVKRLNQEIRLLETAALKVGYGNGLWGLMEIMDLPSELKIHLVIELKEQLKEAEEQLKELL